jgi:uncharacterized Zn finger protein
MIVGGGIANILHRGTLAVIVGSKLFDRGEQCFSAGRVVRVETSTGELRGIVKPTEAHRAHYVTRVWVRDEGLAYECTCPIGIKRQFCKHAVAVALAHLAHERATAERDFAVLREAMLTVRQESLVTGMLRLAKENPELATSLKRICLDALTEQQQQPPS